MIPPGDRNAPIGSAPRRARAPAALAAGLGLLALAACFAPRTLGPGEAARLEPGECLVLGRLRVVFAGLDVSRPAHDLAEALVVAQAPLVKLSLFHVERSKRALYVPLESDGTFGWVLPQGSYLVYVTPPGPPAHNVVVAAFRVPPGVPCLDVGCLVLGIAPGGSDGGPEDYAVLAARVEAASAPRALPPDLEGEPRREPMFTDAELFGLFDDYSRARCERILARHGE